MGRVLVIGNHDALVDRLQADPGACIHHLETCDNAVAALQCVRRRAIDVAVTDPATSMREDLALARELRACRPGLKLIALAPSIAPDDVIAALRAHVFACFTWPLDTDEIASMVQAALFAGDWRDGIEVLSGLRDWVTIRATCRLLTANRLVRFMTEMQVNLPDGERDRLLTAFREMLLNAMEHGGGFDPEKTIEITAARTARAIVYHFRDPGGGFDREDVADVTASGEPEQSLSTAIRRAELGLRPGGFGILMARAIVDELVYNECGNEVLLIKHLTD